MDKEEEGFDINSLEELFASRRRHNPPPKFADVYGSIGFSSSCSFAIIILFNTYYNISNILLICMLSWRRQFPLPSRRSLTYYTSFLCSAINGHFEK